jgi:hypothetical protein
MYTLDSVILLEDIFPPNNLTPYQTRKIASKEKESLEEQS